MDDEKKKNVAAILVAKLKKPELGPDDRDDESSEDEGKMSAAEEVLSAMEAKDPKALSEALSAFWEMC